MTMSIARLSAQSGLRYLFKTTMTNDLAVSPADATTYYMNAGTPEGRWVGAGLRGIDRMAGAPVTETDAKAVFDSAVHPDTLHPLAVLTTSPPSSTTRPVPRPYVTASSAST